MLAFFCCCLKSDSVLNNKETMDTKQDIVGVCFKEVTFYISEVPLTSMAIKSPCFAYHLSITHLQLKDNLMRCPFLYLACVKVEWITFDVALLE